MRLRCWLGGALRAGGGGCGGVLTQGKSHALAAFLAQDRSFNLGHSPDKTDKTYPDLRRRVDGPCAAPAFSVVEAVHTALATIALPLDLAPPRSGLSSGSTGDARLDESGHGGGGRGEEEEGWVEWGGAAIDPAVDSAIVSTVSIDPAACEAFLRAYRAVCLARLLPGRVGGLDDLSFLPRPGAQEQAQEQASKRAKGGGAFGGPCLAAGGSCPALPCPALPPTLTCTLPCARSIGRSRDREK